MKIYHYVQYVIGSFLAFPISVFHILTDTGSKEEERSAKGHARARSTPCPKGQPLMPAASQQGVKRTCGNAQKSVRVKHNSIPALKHK